MRELIQQRVQSVTQLPDWIPPDNTQHRLCAVLIPIVLRKELDTIILTERTAHLNHHAGQVSFPGGRADADDSNAIDTALRETHEEVGIPAEQINIVGYLDQYTSVSNFVITPVVGFVDPDHIIRADAFEVDATFEIPCELAFNPESYQQSEIFWQGEIRTFWETHYEGHHIWGATAAILRNFALLLAPQT